MDAMWLGAKSAHGTRIRWTQWLEPGPTSETPQSRAAALHTCDLRPGSLALYRRGRPHEGDHFGHSCHYEFRLVKVDPVSAFAGDDMPAVLRVGGNGSVFPQSLWGLLRPR